MPVPAPRWISESDVVQLMHLGEAVEALRRGLLEEAAGTARNMEKTAAHWGTSSNMHAIGAVFEDAGVFGTKTWGNTPEGGSTPLLLLWHATTARLLAIIEARALGQMHQLDDIRFRNPAGSRYRHDCLFESRFSVHPAPAPAAHRQAFSHARSSRPAWLFLDAIRPTSQAGGLCLPADRVASHARPFLPPPFAGRAAPPRSMRPGLRRTRRATAWAASSR